MSKAIPMKTGYKHIVFRTDSMNPLDWVCMNRRAAENNKSAYATYLGRCTWYTSWRCWIFQADNNAVWSEDCLTDIADFLRQLNSIGPPV
jgi:hypothetical protein